MADGAGEIRCCRMVCFSSSTWYHLRPEVLVEEHRWASALVISTSNGRCQEVTILQAKLSTYNLIAVTSARATVLRAVVAFPSLPKFFGFLLSDGLEFFDHNPCSHGVRLRTWVDEFALEVYVVEERRQVVVRPGFVGEVDLPSVKRMRPKNLEFARTGVEISLSKESNWRCASALCSSCLRYFSCTLSWFRSVVVSRTHSHWLQCEKANYQEAGMMETQREVYFDQRELTCRRTRR